ncbi:MAG: cupredoxin domain-containing protein [Candidatus Saccharimonadales bacterium]
MKKVLLILLSLIIVGGGAYYLVSRRNDSKISPVTGNSAQSTSTGSQTASQSKVAPASTCVTKIKELILYCDSGFSDYLNVIVGEKVTVKNSSSKVLDFESFPETKKANSTTYKPNDVFNLGKINPGESKTFTAKPLGEYMYYDKNIPAHTGILGIEDDL